MELPDFLVDHPDGEIRLTGSRIGLFDVVSHYNDGLSPEMLVEQYPSISLAMIHKVISFYRDNRAAVDAYVAEYQADLDRQRAKTPQGGPSIEEMRRRMQAMRQGNVK